MFRTFTISSIWSTKHYSSKMITRPLRPAVSGRWAPQGAQFLGTNRSMLPLQVVVTHRPRRPRLLLQQAGPVVLPTQPLIHLASSRGPATCLLVAGATTMVTLDTMPAFVCERQSLPSDSTLVVPWHEGRLPLGQQSGEDPWLRQHLGQHRSKGEAG